MGFALRLALFLLFCVAQTASVASAYPSQGPQRISGTRVWLTPPAEFEPSASFPGFLHPASGASLHIVEVDGSIDETASVWDDESILTARGMKLQSSEPMPHGSYRGRLCKASQVVGTLHVTKWVWTIGTGERTVMIIGTCPDEAVSEYLDTLRVAVLSSSWKPDFEFDPLEGLPFTMLDHGGMVAWHAGTFIRLNADGKVDESGKKPIFVGGPSLAPYTGDRRKYVKRRLRQTAHHRSFRTASIEPIEIDGLSGFEIHATAKDRKDSGPKSIYQVMLFEGTSYWLFQGIVASDQSERHIPEFERIAKSFRRKHDVLTSSSRLATISVPSVWSTRSGIDNESDIQAGHPIGQCYLALNSFPKDGLLDNLSFDLFARGVLSEAESTSIEEVQPVEVMIAGMRALTGEAEVEESGMALTYFTAVVAGPSAYHVATFWCLTSSADSCRPEFQRILATMREVE